MAEMIAPALFSELLRPLHRRAWVRIFSSTCRTSWHRAKIKTFSSLTTFCPSTTPTLEEVSGCFCVAGAALMTTNHCNKIVTKKQQQLLMIWIVLRRFIRRRTSSPGNSLPQPQLLLSLLHPCQPLRSREDRWHCKSVDFWSSRQSKIEMWKSQSSKNT